MKITNPNFISLLEKMADFEWEETEDFRKLATVLKTVAEKEKEVQDRLFLAFKDERENDDFDECVWQAELAYDRGDIKRADDILKDIGY